MTKLPCTIIAIFLAAGALSRDSSAQALAAKPGFNCAKAQTEREKTICGSAELSAIDARMTAAYKSLMTAATPEIQSEIRALQVRSLHDTTTICNTYRRKPQAYSACLRSNETGQAEALEQMIAHKGGITFLWRTDYLVTPDDPRDPDQIEDDKVHGSPTCYVHISWPEAQSTAPEWVAWNKAMAAAGKSYEKVPPDWPKEWALDNDINVTVDDLDLVSNDLVTASFTVSIQNHGVPYGYSFGLEFNWLLKEQRLIQPADVFNPSTQWSKQLYDRTYKGVMSTKISDASYYSTNLPNALPKIIADPNDWRIGRNGLSLNFNIPDNELGEPEATAESRV